MNLIGNAVVCYEKALTIDPLCIDSLYNIGSICLETGKAEEAVRLLGMAAQYSDRLSQDRIDVYINLGLAFMNTGDLVAAEEAFKKAIDVAPGDTAGYINLGNCLRLQQMPEEALSQYLNALVIDAKDPDIYINMGVIYRDMLHTDKAINCYKKAIELDPENAEAHYNLALALLLTGDFKQGWGEYQWRWKTRDFLLMHKRKKGWDGRVGNYRILIRTEQGFGDTIQFVRYVQMLADLGMGVTLLCPKQLQRLLEDCCGIERVIVNEHEVDDFDLDCYLLDLPYIFKDHKQSLALSIPYIFAPHEYTERCKEIIGQLIGTFPTLRIGLFWSGSPTNKRAAHRSCPLKELLPLISMKGVRFFSLQIEDKSDETSLLPEDIRLFDLSRHISDFADTAGFINNLDLVITIDSAVAHLAGAMGRPVWLMLHYSSDWRWMLERKDSPWYPTMRIFRQRRFGIWNDVVDEVAQGLSNLLMGFTPS